MARNGSGTYSLPAGNPVVTGTTISSTTHNTTMSDIAAAITASLAKDGQTTPTANLPMGSYRHTTVGNALARDQYASAAQVEDGSLVVLSSVSGTNTITATGPLSVSAYATGQSFKFVASATNTGAVTINVNSIGAKSITKSGSTALVAGDILLGAVYEICYDGTRFQLINPAIGGFVSSLAAPGYAILPNGLILQWGAATSSGTAAGNVTVTLPYTFPTLAIASFGIASAGGTNSLVVTKFSLSASEARYTLSDGAGAGVSGGGINWFAIGY